MISDERLIRDIANGSPRSFELLMRRYEVPIRYFIYRYVKDFEKAKDLTQDVFLKIWTRAETYRSGEAKVSTWLYTIAKNTVFSDYKRTNKYYTVSIDEEPEDRRPLVLPDLEPLADRRLSVKEAIESMNRVIHQLPDEYREVLILREFYGMSYDEIASTLTINKGTVKSRLNRGREMMKALTLDAL